MRVCILLISLISVVATGAPTLAADGTAILEWRPNTEVDLAGHKVYRSTVAGQYGAPVATIGKVQTYTLTLPQLQVDTTYFMVITAYDLTGNESAKSNEVSKLVPAAAVVEKPGTPVLTVGQSSPTAIDVLWSGVSDGIGGQAQVEVRYGVAPLLWGSMTAALCTSSPCTIANVIEGKTYQVQAIAYRGTLNVDAVFGPLSLVSTVAIPDVPPVPPAGLIIKSASASEIVIIAKTLDCPRIVTSTKGSTSTQLQRTLRCVQ